jgi:putative ABC transport system permease protein
VERLIVDAVPASAAYFSSLGIPLRSGRLFDQHDSASAEPVMIMSEGAYQHFFGSAGDRSRTLPLRLPGTPKPANVRVVGVVGDVRFSGLGRVPANTIYLPYLQWPMATVYLFVRCADSPEAALPQIRRAIGEVDRGIAVIAAQTGGEIVGSATASPRLQTFVLVAFTVLALVIAVVGIYGVVSYFVVGRAPEIAIRLALGCSRGRVVFLVVREGVVLGLVGLLSGLAGAFLLGRTFEHALFGIVPFEYSAYVVASAVLMAVVVVSSYLPARRAACIAPSDALR